MKVGIIGCGKQAEKHIQGLRAAGVENIVVADIDSAVLRNFAEKENVEAAESSDVIFRDKSVDGVVVCTPTKTHHQLMIDALHSGKYVFCEKPLCSSVKEVDEVERLATQFKKFVQVGYVYRYVPAFSQLKQIMDGSDAPLGTPVTGLLRIGGRGSHQLWKHKVSSSGGAINEMLVHMLDLALWLFGSLESLEMLDRQLLRSTRVIGGSLEKVDAEDFVLLRARAKNGLHLIFQADMVTPAFRQIVEVQGDNGSFVGSIQSTVPSFLSLIEGRGKYSPGQTDFQYKQVNLFTEQMKSFVENIRQGVVVRGATPKDSSNILKLLSSI